MVIWPGGGGAAYSRAVNDLQGCGTAALGRVGIMMRNIEDVLKQKEARIHQLRVEIEALRLVAPLLASGEQAAAAGAQAGGGNVTVIPSTPRPDDKLDLSSFLNDVSS